MTPHRPIAGRARSGATLTEVLMSLLVMGLGITSVFTLFPMSVLRSIKSTNLTNAALLAESARDFYVFRRDQLSRQPARHNSGIYTWAKDPLLYRSTTATINSQTAGGDTLIPQPFAGTFMVDPYGGINATNFGNDPGRYGRVLRVLNMPVNLGANGVAGNSGNPVDLLLGDDSVDLTSTTSPDSWITAVEQVPISVVNTTCAVDGTTPVTQIEFGPEIDFNTSISSFSRVLLMSIDNRQSFTRGLHTNFIDPARPYVLQVVPQLAAADLPGVGNVRVQNFERRYTYMFTLHYDESGESFGQIVVFFRREFGDSEQTFQIKDNTIDTLNRRLTVQLGGSFTGRAPGAGDYIFGTWLAKPNKPVVHGRWYRIVSVVELPSASWAVPGQPEYRLTLDRNWEGLWHPNNQPRVMLPGGVVSVFDL